MGGQQTKELSRRRHEKKKGNLSHSLAASTDSIGSSISIAHPPTSSSFEPAVLVALYDFTPDSGAVDNNTQLEVIKGDRLRFHGRSDHGDWTDVTSTRTGSRGWLPSSYLGPTRSASSDSGLDSDDPTNNSRSLPRADSPLFPLPPPPSTLCDPPQASPSTTQPYEPTSGAWYHGRIKRGYAEYLLANSPTGTFLVRASEANKWLFTISLRCDGRNVHYRVHHDDVDNKYYVSTTIRFTRLSDLIRHHEKVSDGLCCCLLYPLTPSSNSKTSSPVGAGEATSASCDAWEIDRNQIVMKHKLGSGQYGVVFEALWIPHGVTVAVKTLKANVAVRDEFLEEARLMKSLKHPNLVKLLAVCTTDPPYYIVTEFMCNGNLLGYLHTRPRTELKPSVLLYMATQVADGMAYLEQHNFIHRDLAARNCLVGPNHSVKVADFGLARCCSSLDRTYQAHEGAKFPIKWTAPEGLVYNLFTIKSDVWAFGVLLWEIATYGKAPYPGIDLQDVYVFLERGNRMHRPPGCPKPIYDLMLKCWQWHRSDRPSFSQLRGQLVDIQSNGDVDDDLDEIDLLVDDRPTPADVHAADQSKVISSRPHPPPQVPARGRSVSCERLLDAVSPTTHDDATNSAKSKKNRIPLASCRRQPTLPADVNSSQLTNQLHRLRPVVTSHQQQSEGQSPPSPQLDAVTRHRLNAPRPPRRTTPIKLASQSIVDNDQPRLPPLLDDDTPSSSSSSLMTSSVILPATPSAAKSSNHQPTVINRSPSSIISRKPSNGHTHQPPSPTTTNFQDELRLRLERQSHKLGHKPSESTSQAVTVKHSYDQDEADSKPASGLFALPRLRSTTKPTHLPDPPDQSPVVVPSNSTIETPHVVRPSSLRRSSRPNHLPNQRLSWAGSLPLHWTPHNSSPHTPGLLAACSEEEDETSGKTESSNSLTRSAIFSSSSNSSLQTIEASVANSNNLVLGCFSDLATRLSDLLDSIALMTEQKQTPDADELIGLADSVDSLRLACAAFTDQSTELTARAKFCLRDRFSSLQSSASELRTASVKRSNRPLELLKSLTTKVKALEKDLGNFIQPTSQKTTPEGDEAVKGLCVQSPTSSDSRRNHSNSMSSTSA